MKNLNVLYKKDKSEPRIKVLVSYIILVWLIGLLNGGKTVVAEDIKPGLKVSIAAAEGFIIYTKGNIPLRISFENVGAEKLRILKQFYPLPVFFAFNMIRKDGTPIDVLGGGKIDFLESSTEYIELNSGGKFDFQINLAEIIPSAEKLIDGEYTISLIYHNQYGKNCFKGSISSNAIVMEIKTP